MKRIFGATVTLAMLAICISSAEAVIKIKALRYFGKVH